MRFIYRDAVIIHGYREKGSLSVKLGNLFKGQLHSANISKNLFCLSFNFSFDLFCFNFDRNFEIDFSKIFTRIICETIFFLNFWFKNFG